MEIRIIKLPDTLEFNVGDIINFSGILVEADGEVIIEPYLEYEENPEVGTYTCKVSVDQEHINTDFDSFEYTVVNRPMMFGATPNASCLGCSGSQRAAICDSECSIFSSGTVICNTDCSTLIRGSCISCGTSADASCVTCASSSASIKHYYYNVQLGVNIAGIYYKQAGAFSEGN